MASLIQLLSFQLHSKILSFNLSITPSPLNKELYKIKTKFKSFFKKDYPDLFFFFFIFVFILLTHRKAMEVLYIG